MFFYDCEAGFVPDDGQNDVRDGSVVNYPLDWETADAAPEYAARAQAAGDADTDMMPDDGPAREADAP